MGGVRCRVRVLPRRACGANAVVRRVWASVCLKCADGTARRWIPPIAPVAVVAGLVPPVRTVRTPAVLLQGGCLHTVPARRALRGEAFARGLPPRVLKLAVRTFRAPNLVR